MELNINSPSYFTKQYGVIDEIYSMCRGISKHVENKQYSDLVDIVGITPIIAPKDIIEQGLFKQEKKCDIISFGAYGLCYTDYSLLDHCTAYFQHVLIYLCTCCRFHR